MEFQDCIYIGLIRFVLSLLIAYNGKYRKISPHSVLIFVNSVHCLKKVHC